MMILLLKEKSHPNQPGPMFCRLLCENVNASHVLKSSTLVLSVQRIEEEFFFFFVGLSFISAVVCVLELIYGRDFYRLVSFIFLWGTHEL